MNLILRLFVSMAFLIIGVQLYAGEPKQRIECSNASSQVIKRVCQNSKRVEKVFQGSQKKEFCECFSAALEKSRDQDNLDLLCREYDNDNLHEVLGRSDEAFDYMIYDINVNCFNSVKNSKKKKVKKI